MLTKLERYSLRVKLSKCQFMQTSIEYLVEIDRYISLPIFFPIFKHFTIIGYRFGKKIIYFFFTFFFLLFFFNLSYTMIQSITSSEMCSLHLTVHSGKAPARPPHVTLHKIHLFETH